MPRREARLAGAALAGVAVLIVVGTFAAGIDHTFANSDEVIYAQFVREMHATGDYFTIRYLGHETLQRPAAPVALYALVSRVVPGEYGLRVAPAVLTALAAVAAGAIAWRRWGRLGAGVAAMLVAAATPTVFVYGRMLLSDPPFVLACVGALAATMAAQAHPRWLFWAGAALGAAFASKSFAAGIPALALAPWLLVAARRHWRDPRWRLWKPVAAFVVVAAPFYVVGFARHGSRFASEHFGNILLDRARGSLEGIGVGGPLAYLEHVWRADGVVLALLLGGSVLGSAWLAWRRRDAALGVAVTYVVVTACGLSAVGTRLPHYLLMTYPAAAVCAGALVAWGQERLERWRAGAGAPAGMGAALALAGMFYLTTAAPPFDALAYPDPEAVTLGRAARELVPAGEPVYALDWYAPAFSYYAERPWRMLSTEARPARIVGAIGIFHQARVVLMGPPWPPGRFVVGGPGDRLERATRLADPLPRGRLVAAEGDYQLWEIP